MIIQEYYISTGSKNAMYTLRCNRSAPNASCLADSDFYLCNLSADVEKAVEKATQYVDAIKSRISETKTLKIEFGGVAAHADKRRGKLSIADTRKLEIIEAGVFPFGKHKGEPISNAPDSYLLFFADKTIDGDLDVVMQALAAACMGVALEKGLIAKRDAARTKRAEKDALSNFIGVVGERREFSGEVITSFSKGITIEGQYLPSYWINKIRCGADIVTYIGNKALGAVGENITFRATIKRHEIYGGVCSTVVSRPK